MLTGVLMLYVTLIGAGIVVTLLNRSTCPTVTNRPRDTYSKSPDPISRAKHESAPEHTEEAG
jgi:hypothetical protein